MSPNEAAKANAAGPEFRAPAGAAMLLTLATGAVLVASLFAVLDWHGTDYAYLAAYTGAAVRRVRDAPGISSAAMPAT